MEKREPVLEFRLSRPGRFHCSFCRSVADEGAFSPTGDVEVLLAEFKEHVDRCHHAGEDFSQVINQ